MSAGSAILERIGKLEAIRGGTLWKSMSADTQNAILKDLNALKEKIRSKSQEMDNLPF